MGKQARVNEEVIITVEDDVFGKCKFIIGIGILGEE